jgi:hypothetical protein
MFGYKLGGKRPLGRPRRMLEDNTKMDLKEIGWVHLIQDRDHWKVFVKTGMNLRVP